MNYFIADLHLSEAEPAITRHFLNFLEQQAIYAEKLFILGDLFDFWIGDDEQSPLIQAVKKGLNALAASGVKTYFLCGNRDFLIGECFAREANLTLLPDYYLLPFNGQNVLLCHGDTLCTDDVSYQRFRRKVHQKWRQRLFLCLPLRWRLKIAERIRAKSQRDKQQKAWAIMDVNPSFTAAKMAEYQATLLIHGHTHRQQIHQEQGFERIVLGDWAADRLSILQMDEKGVRFV